MVNLTPAEYITQFDGGTIPTPSTSWALTSPNASVWAPSITTGGILSLATGGTAGDTVSFIGLDGTVWTPSIDNAGLITVTQGAVISSSDYVATVVDSASVTWVLYVDDNQQVRITTAAILPTLLRYPAFTFSYTPASGTDLCLIHSIRLGLNTRRRAA